MREVFCFLIPRRRLQIHLRTSASRSSVSVLMMTNFPCSLELGFTDVPKIESDEWSVRMHDVDTIVVRVCVATGWVSLNIVHFACASETQCISSSNRAKNHTFDQHSHAHHTGQYHAFVRTVHTSCLLEIVGKVVMYFHRTLKIAQVPYYSGKNSEQRGYFRIEQTTNAITMDLTNIARLHANRSTQNG